MEPDDQWCEIRMWQAVGVQTSVEILGVVSGVAFLVVPWYERPSVWTDLHVALYVVLCYLGAGTIVYHAIPNTEVGGQALIYMMDYVPMVLTCAFLSSLYLWHFAKMLYEWAVFAVLSALVGWFLFLIMSVYLVSVATRNAVMVAPPVLIFTTDSSFVLGSRSLRVWALLVLSLVLWLINKELCARQYWLGTFHAIYHVLMAYALWGAGKLGIGLLK
jgi:hypothetical protein